MIHNVLSRQLPVEPARVADALAVARIAPDRRPQTLAVGEWLALREALGPIGTDERGRHAGGHGRREHDEEVSGEAGTAEEHPSDANYRYCRILPVAPVAEFSPFRPS